MYVITISLLMSPQAQAFLMEHIKKTGHNLPRGPSASWYLWYGMYVCILIEKKHRRKGEMLYLSLSSIDAVNRVDNRQAGLKNIF
jgi:hypothetical protein